jgi:hypothetical protein
MIRILYIFASSVVPYEFVKNNENDEKIRMRKMVTVAETQRGSSADQPAV